MRIEITKSLGLPFPDNTSKCRVVFLAFEKCREYIELCSVIMPFEKVRVPRAGGGGFDLCGVSTLIYMLRKIGI
jgi:hypothetical protein